MNVSDEFSDTFVLHWKKKKRLVGFTTNVENWLPWYTQANVVNHFPVLVTHPFPVQLTQGSNIKFNVSITESLSSSVLYLHYYY